MARRFSDFDESDVRVRPGKGSRPRSKDRPSHDDAVDGMVVTKDRGRWGVVIEDTGAVVQCMRARELKRVSVEVGDRVGVVGDTSGRKDTLARIVKRAERSSVLRRTADDTDPYERIIVANAELLLIVTAVADPPPRIGFVERALIAAFVGGVTPVVCLTKSDLADPGVFRSELTDLDVDVLEVGIDDEIDELTAMLTGRLTALIGHSGVGKSTLVNRIVPGANRLTGEVSGVGKGRHTSTQSVALEVPGGGWIIDTPGIRSFGLAHVSPDQVVAVFPELAAAAEDCPRGCSHLGPPADPECAWDALDADTPVGRRARAVRRLLEALRSNNEWELKGAR
ncbi:ribosome small subunit-dependent GTPase A [Corynebacterium liangguodongii]|uniref:Ribosome small subunit-dependent GTPase A n=1 Tax=Corynebacterium liangguodongii TaxID=2079535 RepID=A0A2S0WCQ7_9CORY|nr:ribosome small subunit-dependent GTPase A [Corynebacterium liangguodongii]AWB83551.1 ribosome small subunit-dependent GTPase A [Corynebacterium liangguodongii]PWC00359.1 ribosome small subunit-dependent GTPase A [Corynebacterium liangguodongii]